MHDLPSLRDLSSSPSVHPSPLCPRILLPPTRTITIKLSSTMLCHARHIPQEAWVPTRHLRTGNAVWRRRPQAQALVHPLVESASSQLLVSLTCGKVYSPNLCRFWERTPCPPTCATRLAIQCGAYDARSCYSISSTPRRFKASRFIGITIWSISSWSDRGVNAIFASGFTDTGSFLVGCDGLHGVRAVLFGEDPITFLGFTQVRYARSDGNLVMTRTFIRVVLAPLPAIWSTTHVINWRGNGAHMMSYPVFKVHTSRVYVSQSQPPSNLGADQREVDKMKRTRIAKWEFGASRLIETAEKVVKACRTLRWRCDSSIDLDLEFSVKERKEGRKDVSTGGQARSSASLCD